MVRYKKRRHYKKSTNIVTMKFQSFMDIQTTDSSMQIITISAGGPEILRRLAPQFSAYKYYKIGNISAKLVPATTLPVDPSGLSINAGSSGVNPWDQLSPGLMRITNGEDIFEDLSGLSTAEQDAIYKNMLLDPRWYKWMLQTGVKRHASPRYWIIGQLHQDKWPGAIQNVPVIDGSDNSIDGTETILNAWRAGAGPMISYGAGSSPYGFFQTGHTGVLGWLPTDGLQKVVQYSPLGDQEVPFIASPPEVEVFKIILPRAILTKYAYRLYISETVYFREPIVNFGVLSGSYAYRPLDVFHSPSYPLPMLPGTGDSNGLGDAQTGGNYGNN